MKKYPFAPDGPVKRRENVVAKRPYQEYKEELREDFHNRCGYCGSSFEVGDALEIDHFVPERVFKGIEDELKDDYQNLVCSCRRCNRTKGGKYSGSKKKGEFSNQLFYDPGATDFNKLFYRVLYGIIWSDDEKARKMIMLLRLHDPIYALLWQTERLLHISKSLENYQERTNDAHYMAACLNIERDFRKLMVFIKKRF